MCIAVALPREMKLPSVKGKNNLFVLLNLDGVRHYSKSGIISAHCFYLITTSFCLCFLTSPSFVPRNMLIRQKKKPLFSVFFSKHAKNAKVLHDDH